MPDAAKTATHADLVGETLKTVNETKKQILTAQEKVKTLESGPATPQGIQEINTALSEALKKAETASASASKAVTTHVSLTLSVEREGAEPKADQGKVNRLELGSAFLILLVSGLVVLFDWRASDNPGLWHPPGWIAYALILLIDVYLIGLLRGVVYQGSKGKDKWIYTPDRGPAIFLLGFLYFALMLSFAHLNWSTQLMTSHTLWESAFEGFLTVATFEHTSFDVKEDAFRHLLVVGQLLSVVLFYFVFLPLLVARLALFKDETVSANDLGTVLQLDVKGLKPLRLKVEADSPLDLIASGISAGATKTKTFGIDSTQPKLQAVSEGSREATLEA